MKILIAEDDFVSRTLIQEIMGQYGAVHIATNGREAVDAYSEALKRNEPYDLICLDIMMPEMDGQEALREIRKLEHSKGIGGSNSVKIVMVTALSDPKNIMQALIKGPCDAYINKPVSTEEIKRVLIGFGFPEIP